MTHQEKIEWMAMWAVKNHCALELEGSVGFGRACVGIITNTVYPDYQWFDKDYNRVDNNGEVWIPEQAYHKHECVAVLGRGEEAESQLYEWLQWFDKNNFKLESKIRDDVRDPLEIILGKHIQARMVRKEV